VGVERLAFVLAITLVSSAAYGHVAPSVDDNNRYLKVTPLGDRVRVAYTILFGEIPGAAERRRIDADGDGSISDAEARAFAGRIGAEVAAALQLDVDGAAQPVRWASVDASMQTPAVVAGTFAIDLVAYACFDEPRGRHRVMLRDRFTIATPGEVGASVEDSPGVTIERAHIGRLDEPGHDFVMPGPATPLADDGLELVFVAGARAPVASDDSCPPPRSTRGWLVWAIGGALGGVALATTLVLVRRRRSRDAPANGI
jgi:hypothetical protein